MVQEEEKATAAEKAGRFAQSGPWNLGFRGAVHHHWHRFLCLVLAWGPGRASTSVLGTWGSCCAGFRNGGSGLSRQEIQLRSHYDGAHHTGFDKCADDVHVMMLLLAAVVDGDLQASRDQSLK